MKHEHEIEKFYYRTKDSTGWFGFKPDVSQEELEANYVRLTEEEWYAHLESLKPAPLTPEQIAEQEKQRQIGALKAYLRNTDWVICKIAEETDEEVIASLREKYASVIAERKAKRAEINELESEE